jgi:hypothetical protein
MLAEKFLHHGNISGRAVAFPATGAVVPEGCACCGAPAARSRLEQTAERARSLIVPYCERCLRHASARTTRNLAAALSSCLVALTLTLALPLAWPGAPLVLFVSVVAVLSAAPLVWRRFWPRRPATGHTALERAAWWLPDGSLACTQPEWAGELARRSGGQVRAARSAEPRFAAWLPAGVVVALVAGPAGWFLHHPLVRVLNLTGSRIVLFVDGRQLATMDPTSSENPAAGIEVRIPSGERRLVTRTTEGATLAEANARLTAGAHHLWAPGSEGYCFWLEETRYGKATREPDHVEPLSGAGRFWTLPSRVDTWFSANPPPLGPDQRSTGGVLVALRQSRCEQAPPQARP